MSLDYSRTPSNRVPLKGLSPNKPASPTKSASNSPTKDHDSIRRSTSPIKATTRTTTIASSSSIKSFAPPLLPKRKPISQSPSSNKLAFRLKNRLRLAHYKVVTEQTNISFSHLPPPDWWSVHVFAEATNDRRSLEKQRPPEFKLPSSY